jgi:hypothetical protein
VPACRWPPPQRRRCPDGLRGANCACAARLRLIPVEDIRYLQADEKYVVIHHAKGEDLLEESLRSLEEEFGGRFVRIHRNCLIARDQLAELQRGGDGQLLVRLLDGNRLLEVSRRCAAQVRANSSARREPTVRARFADNARMTTLRIATRKSPLALWQSEHVAARLRRLHPGLEVLLVPMSTRGDEVLDRSLAAIGGKACSSRSWSWRCCATRPIAPCTRSRTCRWTSTPASRWPR